MHSLDTLLSNNIVVDHLSLERLFSILQSNRIRFEDFFVVQLLVKLIDDLVHSSSSFSTYTVREWRGYDTILGNVEQILLQNANGTRRSGTIRWVGLRVSIDCTQYIHMYISWQTHLLSPKCQLLN